MKIKVEIITGFLGSGKSTLIKELAELTQVPGERILIVQWEAGSVSLDVWAKGKAGIRLRRHNPAAALSPMQLKNLLLLYAPHRVIFEHNGSRPMQELLEVLQDRDVRSLARISGVYHIADAKTAPFYIRNMGDIIASQVTASDLILLHNTAPMAPDEKLLSRRLFETLAPETRLVEVPDITGLRQTMAEADLFESMLYKKVKLYVQSLL